MRNRRVSAWLLAALLTVGACAPVCRFAEKVDPIVAATLDAGPPPPKVVLSIGILRAIATFMCSNGASAVPDQNIEPPNKD